MACLRMERAGVRISLVLAMGLSVAFLVSCVTVPEAGRSQLLLVSPSEEAQLGLTEFEKLKKSTPVSKDAANMARAGYDPREAIDFWKRFAAYSDQHAGKPIEFLSTHPVDSTRIAQLESLMPQALAEYQATGQSR